MDVLPFLGQIRARLRRVLVIEGLARIFATALLLAGAAVLADFAWPSPGWLRLLVLAAILVGLGFIAQRRLLRPLGQPFDDKSLARFAERRLPHLDGRLLSAVEGLALGHEQSALAGELARHPAATLVPAPRLPRWLGGATALVTVVVVTAVFAPRFFNDACIRLLAPLSSREWARATTLTGTLTPAVVAADQKLTLAITRHHDGDGDFSAPVVVSWAHADLPGQTEVPVESRQLPGLHGTDWTASLPALPPGIWAITVTSADAVPLHLTGRSVARPALGHITARLTPPPYVQAPAVDLPTLACAALPGSRLDFQIAFTTADARAIASAGVDAVWSPAPPALAKLAAPPGGRLPASATAAAAAGPGIITGSIIITRAGTLTVAASDADGIALDPPPRFAVTLLEDRPPTVSLDGPGHDEAVSAHGVIDVKVEGGDDHGLALLELLGSVSDLSEGQAPASSAVSGTTAAPATETTIANFPGAVGATATTWPLALAIADHAALNQRLTLVGHARDANDISGPGDTRSEAVSLRVVSDEELRQELERLLATARERVTQSREELAAAASKPEAQPAAARSAGLVADKATALLVQVLRRWKQNALPAEQIVPAGQAKDLIVVTAGPALNEAAGTAAKDASAAANLDATAAAAALIPPRDRADAALAEAERLLGTLLQDGDLTRRLTALIGQETTLADETRKFTLEFLDHPLDDAGRTRKANLSQRQLDLAHTEADIERQVLGGAASNLNAAKEVVRANPAQEPLNQAGEALASDSWASTPTQQAAGLDAMKKLLEALRGGDAQGKLADRVGELAAEEEAILKALDAGTPPPNLAEQQRDVKEKTERLQPEVARQDPDAGKAMAAAAAAATAAGAAMAKGDGSGSSQSAGATASLLRTAQSKLDPKSGDDDKDADKKNDPKKASIVALLRALLGLQGALVADCTVLDARLGEQDPDFSAQRDLQGFAQTQSDILLRLHQEGEEPLKDPQDPHPVALAALERVAATMDAAHDHLAKPALGAQGMRLERIALAELARLVAIVDGKGQPPPKSGGGKGDGSGKEAPFPPAAEIAWLAANQEDLAAETAAGRPVDLAANEAALRDLAATIAGALRPGTRPGILMERVRRATASAAWRLGKQDRGATTRDEQDAAVAALRRILAEIEAGSGGGKSSGDGQTARNSKPKSQQGRNNQSAPAPGDKPGDPKGSTAPSGGANGQDNHADGAHGDQVETAQNGNSGLNLPEEKRKQLAEVLRENLSPSEKQLYRAYIEELDAKP